MGRDYAHETTRRVEWIKDLVKKSGAKGIIFGNSGGKDSALVGILCQKACANVLGVIMPCVSKQNYNQDREHALLLAEQFSIETIEVDLTDMRNLLCERIEKITPVSDLAKTNINPRLRMTTLYAIGQTMGYLVAGTGNRSEAYMGYFTKWGDGAYDFNPILDLCATEIFEFLQYLNAPKQIIEKPPSAGLYEGQTDEKEMGVSYGAIDRYIMEGTGSEQDVKIINSYHSKSEHKRQLPLHL